MNETSFEWCGRRYVVRVHPQDVRESHCRGSGPGGQNKNKVATGVRLVHAPTGIQAVSTAYNSQPQNREAAWRSLMGRVAERIIGVLHEGWRRKQTARFAKADRTYALDGDPRVVDHRTGHREADPQAVLDGNLDGFLRPFLTQR